jgi:hypothetical protein
MTVAAEFAAAQDGALVVRRRQQPTMQSVPVSEQVLDEVARLSEVLELVPKPPSIKVNAKSEETSPPSIPNETITLERKTRVCRVEALLRDRFTAIFSEPGLVDQRVTVLCNRVASSDRQLLREGAVFYWITGTERDPSGDLISYSYIRFRRRPRLSPRQADELDRLADEAILAGGAMPTSDEDLD